MRAKAGDFFGAKKTIFAAQLGTVLATVKKHIRPHLPLKNMREKSSTKKNFSFAD